jgi:hypothetical protein
LMLEGPKASAGCRKVGVAREAGAIEGAREA